ncbi:MAG: hypothetical protein AAFX99_09275 [Myxococcota bacterium]
MSFDATGHALGIDVIWQPDTVSPMRFRRVIREFADVLINDLPYTSARIATVPDGAKAVISGVLPSGTTPKLVVHELLFDVDVFDTEDLAFHEFEPLTHVEGSSATQVWSAPEGASSEIDSSIALNDAGDTWLVAWSNNGQLYWRLQGDSSTLHTLVPEGEPDFVGVFSTPEVVYLGDDRESPWMVVYNPSFAAPGSDTNTITNTAYLLLNTEGEYVDYVEINQIFRQLNGTECIFPQVTSTPIEPVVLMIREPNTSMENANIAMGLRAHRLGSDRLAALHRPHPLGTTFEQRVGDFFPFVDKRILDVHWFHPREDSSPIHDGSPRVRGEQGLYLIWTYSREHTSTDGLTTASHWGLMWSKSVLPNSSTTRLQTSCPP